MRSTPGVVFDYRLARAASPPAAAGRWRSPASCCRRFCATRWPTPTSSASRPAPRPGRSRWLILGLGAGLVSLSMGAFVGALLALRRRRAARPRGRRRARPRSSSRGRRARSSSTPLPPSSSHAPPMPSRRAASCSGCSAISRGVRWPDVTLASRSSSSAPSSACWHARALDAFTFGADSRRLARRAGAAARVRADRRRGA